jgi:hypothetical protein
MRAWHSVLHIWSSVHFRCVLMAISQLATEFVINTLDAHQPLSISLHQSSELALQSAINTKLFRIGARCSRNIRVQAC